MQHGFLAPHLILGRLLLQGGTSIGTKGANLAAKALANSAIKLLENPEIIKMAWDEHLDRVGDHNYQALLGDREPPLDYRK